MSLLAFIMRYHNVTAPKTVCKKVYNAGTFVPLIKQKTACTFTVCLCI